MAKKKLWLVVLAMVLAFGMTVVGCDIEEPDNRPLIGGPVWFDNNYPVIGETITLIPSSSEKDWGTSSLRWYKTKEDVRSLEDAKDKTYLGDNTTYTVKQDDENFWIWAEKSFSGAIGIFSSRTGSTVIGIPSAATVSVSMSAQRLLYNDKYYDDNYSNHYYDNHSVTVTLTLSNGRWNNVYGATQWVTMSGTPSVSSWYNEQRQPSVFPKGRELVFSYTTGSKDTLSIIGLTATLNTAQLNTMRSSTNVYNSLTAGTPSTASVSQWTIVTSRY